MENINENNENLNNENIDNPAQGQTQSSSAELEAYKKLYEEQKDAIEALKKELAETKIVNARLAIQQSNVMKVSTEELLNQMFN